MTANNPAETPVDRAPADIAADFLTLREEMMRTQAQLIEAEQATREAKRTEDQLERRYRELRRQIGALIDGSEL